MLLHMASKVEMVEDWVVIGIAVVSFQLFLRVGEAASVEHWAIHDGCVRFFL